MKVIIAAAGTAGHINPGLSIANKIKEDASMSEESTAFKIHFFPID